MELRELSLHELQQTYGGADTSTSGIGLKIGTGSLLCLSYGWSSGDRSYDWKLEVGKNINADFNLSHSKND